MVRAGRVVAPGEGVEQQDDVVARSVQFPILLPGQRELGQRVAALEFERLLKALEPGLDYADTASTSSRGYAANGLHAPTL